MNLNKYRICSAEAYPENIQLEVSRACQLHCAQCRRTLYDMNGPGITPEVLECVEPVLEQADMLGICGWGESLASPRVWDVLAAAHRSRINPCLTTNGVLLDDNFCRRLIELQLGQVTISLDAGTPEGYRRLRAGAELADIAENIRRLARLRETLSSSLPFIVLTFNFREASAAEFPEFIRLAASLPIFKAAVHPHYPPDLEANGHPWLLSDRARDCYRRGVDLAAELGLHLEPRLEPILDLHLGRPNPETRGQFYLPSRAQVRLHGLFPTCRCVWDFPFIDSEGNVYPCSIYPEPLGNLREDSFIRVWDNERFNAFRQGLVTGEPSEFCLHCRKTMWYPNDLDEPVPPDLPLRAEGLVGLGWYPMERAGRSWFRWSRGHATVFIRNTGNPRLYFIAQALRPTQVEVSVMGRLAGRMAVDMHWGIRTLDLPRQRERVLRVSFTCPDAEDDPASCSPGCRYRLLGLAVSQIGTCVTAKDETPRRALRAVLN